MTREGEFKFGLETEFLLVTADTFRPLWYRDLCFRQLNELLESIPVDDLDLGALKLEAPHRKRMPFVVEGFHVPDPEFNPIDLLPKGIEIRTPVAETIEECLRELGSLYERLQSALAAINYRAVAISFHPVEDRFEGPQNKRRYDFWQWAMAAMTTYGPDVNIGLPSNLARRLDQKDLHARVNHYAPAMTAFTVASPFYRGGLWRIRGAIGKSVRTYHRSIIAPAIEIHSDQALRLEFKSFETTWRLEDFHSYFLLWLEVLLDRDLRGRATNETRIYDLGQVARHGLNAETIADRAEELLDRAHMVLPRWGFGTRPLEQFNLRLKTGRVPADEMIEIFKREGSIPRTLQQLAKLHFTDRVQAQPAPLSKA